MISNDTVHVIGAEEKWRSIGGHYLECCDVGASSVFSAFRGGGLKRMSEIVRKRGVSEDVLKSDSSGNGFREARTCARVYEACLRDGTVVCGGRGVGV